MSKYQVVVKHEKKWHLLKKKGIAVCGQRLQAIKAHTREAADNLGIDICHKCLKQERLSS